MGAPSQQVKRSVVKMSGAVAKNECSYASTPLYAFLAPT
jgi:hypothetical protein